jgi:hypothetical protein
VQALLPRPPPPSQARSQAEDQHGTGDQRTDSRKLSRKQMQSRLGFRTERSASAMQSRERSFEVIGTVGLHRLGSLLPADGFMREISVQITRQRHIPENGQPGWQPEPIFAPGTLRRAKHGIRNGLRFHRSAMGRGVCLR